jgi:hypothetical protein
VIVSPGALRRRQDFQILQEVLLLMQPSSDRLVSVRKPASTAMPTNLTWCVAHGVILAAIEIGEVVIEAKPSRKICRGFWQIVDNVFRNMKEGRSVRA